VTVPGAWYLAVAALLFAVGATGVLVRRNVLVMFMCVELMLNAVNLTFITFARMLDDIGGQSSVFFVLVVAAVLFTIGAVGLLVRRNVLVMFMCVELMLNAVNLTFVTFSRMLDDIGGQAVVFFVMVVAAAEVVVGLGIIVAIFRRRQGATADDLHVLKG